MDIQHIIDLNRTAIDQFGGMWRDFDNLRHDGYGKLDYALAYAPQISDDLYKQAAYLAHKIICGHPFNDGNKRTGFFVCAVYLAMHGIEIEINPDTVLDAVMHLIDGAWGYTHFAEYLKGEK